MVNGSTLEAIGDICWSLYVNGLPLIICNSLVIDDFLNSLSRPPRKVPQKDSVPAVLYMLAIPAQWFYAGLVSSRFLLVDHEHKTVENIINNVSFEQKNSQDNPAFGAPSWTIRPRTVFSFAARSGCIGMAGRREILASFPGQKMAIAQTLQLVDCMLLLWLHHPVTTPEAASPWAANPARPTDSLDVLVVFHAAWPKWAGTFGGRCLEAGPSHSENDWLCKGKSMNWWLHTKTMIWGFERW